jgi:hypothetical protein
MRPVDRRVHDPESGGDFPGGLYFIRSDLAAEATPKAARRGS